MAGAAREGIVTYTALDASQHTQLPGSAPSVDPSHKPPSSKQPSNQPPAQAAAKQPPVLASGAKQKLQARPSGLNEQGALAKEDAGLRVGMPKHAMGTANHTPQGKESEHGRTPSKQLGQTAAQDHKVGGLKDVPAQLPVRQRQRSPALVGSRQPVGSKAAPQGTGVGPSAGQAAKMDRASGVDQAQEARPPFGLFPSTQQSSSQPSSKLAVPVAPRMHSAIETPALEPTEKAQHQQLPQQQQQQHQGQMQSRKAPSMSPSESSSVRPPQDASRRMSTGHAPPAAGLNGTARVRQQQPQFRADTQGNAVDGMHDKDKVVAAAARGSGKNLSADAGWKPRRGRKSSSPAADSPALGGQGGTAPGCRESELKDKDASKLDEQTCASDDAKDQGEDCSLTACRTCFT